MSVRLDSHVAWVIRAILTGEGRSRVDLQRSDLSTYYAPHEMPPYYGSVEFEIREDAERRLPVDVRALARIIGGDVPDRHTVAEMIERVSLELMSIADEMRKGPTEEEILLEFRRSQAMLDLVKPLTIEDLGGVKP